MTSNGCSDVFVTKVSANGKYLLYSTYLGGNNSDVGNGIAVNDYRDGHLLPVIRPP